MAKAKRSKQTTRKTSNKTNSRKKQNRVDIDLAVVSMIIISILLVVLIYTSSGYIGKTLSPLLGGVMGWMKYILPIGTFAIAINLACEKKDTLSPKLIQYGIFLMCIAVIMFVYQLSVGNIDVNTQFGSVLKQSYELGQKNIGGGAIGAIAGIPMVNLLGNTGAIILAIGIAILVLIFMFGIHPAKYITNAVENMEERKEERKQRRLEEDEYEDEEETYENIGEDKLKKINKKELKKNHSKESIDIPLDDDQITINLNDKQSKLKKYDHSDDDLLPLGIGEKKKPSPNEIEANLFKTEEPIKEDKTKEVLQLEHALTVEDEHYEFPPIELLSEGEGRNIRGGKKAIADNATKLQKTLYSFGVSAKVENVSVGPAITRYELKPAEGVRVSKIANLADDIALNLAAASIRIEAPIPGKQAVRNRSTKYRNRNGTFKRYIGNR